MLPLGLVWLGLGWLGLGWVDLMGIRAGFFGTLKHLGFVSVYKFSRERCLERDFSSKTEARGGGGGCVV